MRISTAAIALVLATSLLMPVLVMPSKTFRATAASDPPSTYPPPAVNWTHPYGWATAEEAKSVQQTKDGGYIIAGRTYSTTLPTNDQILLVKIDEDGSYQWSQTYGGDKNDVAHSVQETADGGYIIAGDTNSFGAGSYDAYLIKTYANRSVEWSQTYGGVDGDYACSVHQVNDGGYVVAGSTANGTDFWLFKTGSGGNLEWKQTYPSPDPDEAYSVDQTRDGGFILAGTVYHAAEYQGVLVYANPNGSLSWRKEYGSSGDFNNDYFWSVQETLNGGFICAGWTDSSGAGGVDSWLVKTDSGGNQQWSKTYGGVEDEYTYAVIQANDTGYVLAGYTNSYGMGSFDVYVVKTFSDGEMQWSQAGGGVEGDYGTCICQAKDGGYLVAGYTLSFGGGSCDFYALKISREDADEDGLYDSWEQEGVDYDGDGTIDLVLEEANWRHKDVYVEIDYMGSNGTHKHEPNPGATDDVETAFRGAPVKNPDGEDGINLHIEIDDEIPHRDVIKAWDDFDSFKGNYFGTLAQQQDPNSANIGKAKKQVYRYCLFVHEYATNKTGNWVSTTSSGLAERPGNDFIVSLGGFTDGKGNRDEQASTFMHELGHTLGLGHGGGDGVNYKPNYLSIMNYAFQFHDPNPGRPLDYSRTKLLDLNEANLDENAGVGAEVTAAAPLTIFSNKLGNGFVISSAFLPIDWNQNGKATDTSVSSNINDFPIWDYPSPPGEILTGYNDWGNLVYNFRDLSNFADNAHGAMPPDDLTWEIVQQMQEAAASTHDVAILNVSTPSSMIPTGSSLSLSVTVMNQGGNNETFRVTAYADTTSIALQDVTLERGNIKTIDLTGDTAGFGEGNYTLSAYATPVANETDVSDNNYMSGVFTVSNAMGWVEWSRAYAKTHDAGLVYHDTAYSVCQTVDNGYAIAGIDYSPDADSDVWLIKTNPNGIEQWNRTYGSPLDEGAYSVEQTSDGGYILAGYAQRTANSTSLWLIKTDSEGKMLWNKTHGTSYGPETRWTAVRTIDGGYAAAGSRGSSSSKLDMWLIKTDSAGNELWNKTYGNVNLDESAYSVWQTTDGGYLLGGWTETVDRFGAGRIVKTDSLGNEQWNRTYTKTGSCSAQQTADGGYAVAGTMMDYSQIGIGDTSDFWLLKADANGNTEWSKTYDCARWSAPSAEVAYAFQQTTDGGYVLGGCTTSIDKPGILDVWIVKTDTEGNVQTDLAHGRLTSRTGPYYQDVAYSIREIRDGAYVAAGYTEQEEDPRTYDFLLLKARLLIVIPEFPAWMLLPSLMLLTLLVAVLSRKRGRLTSI